MAIIKVATASIGFVDLNDAIISGTPPNNPTTGMLWIDNSVAASPVLKKWSGSAWVTQPIDLKYLDPDADDKIEDSVQKLLDMADDAVITQAERIQILNDLISMTGKVDINDLTTALPTAATIDASIKKGTFYNLRQQALSAGFSAVHADVDTLEDMYLALCNYLNAMDPKPWNVWVDSNLSITTVATWRLQWLNYYNAESKLTQSIIDKLKGDTDDVSGRVTTAEGVISQHSDDITARVTYESYNSSLPMTIVQDSTFEKGNAFWSLSTVMDGTDVAVTPTTFTISRAGWSGGNALRITGDNWVYSKNAFPVDTSRRYRIRFRARQTVNPTSGGAMIHAGVATYDADGVLQTTEPGSHRYCAVTGVTLTVADGWNEYSGIITGEGNDSHNKFRTGTRYVKPMFIVNNSNGDGTAEVDLLELMDVTDGEALSASIKINADNITSKVEQTDYNGINIVSMINQTAETIKIQAKNIDLVGAVTASSISSLNGLNVADGKFIINSFGNVSMTGNLTSENDLGGASMITTIKDGLFMAEWVPESGSSTADAVMDAWNGFKMSRWTSPSKTITEYSTTILWNSINLFGNWFDNGSAYIGEINFGPSNERKNTASPTYWRASARFNEVDIDMANCDIRNVNHITIADTGSLEGIEWVGGSGWRLIESNDSYGNNVAGNMMFVTTDVINEITKNVASLSPGGQWHLHGDTSLLRMTGTTHTYQDWYIGTTRYGYFGYPSSGNTTLTMKNEQGDITISAKATTNNVNISGKLNASNMAAGQTSITPVANAITSRAVSFGKTFQVAPIVQVSANTSVPNTVVKGVSFGSVTTTGFTVYLYRTDTTSTEVHWFAYDPT
jgi:hypothetical protein